MDIGARAAQLISEVTPHLFLTAAQTTLQQQTPYSSISSKVIPQSEISEPLVSVDSAMADTAVERDNTPASSGNGEEEEEEYEVDKILETQMRGRKRYFKVSWKNYAQEWDTWEPEDMLKEGAAEAIKEFMAKYEANKAKKKDSKTPKSRKRPAPTTSTGSTRNRSRRETVEETVDAAEDDAASIPEPPSSDDDNNFTPSKKGKSGPKTKSTPTSSNSRTRSNQATKSGSSRTTGDRLSAAASTTPAAAASNGFNKTPWFMDTDGSSSDEEETNSPSRNNNINNHENINDTTNSSPPQTIPNDGSSNNLKLVIKSKNSTENGDDNHEADDVVNNEKKHKKDKHKKKDKKSRMKLAFEGIYRRAPGEPLSFVAQQVGVEGPSTAFSLEEAIEADSRSLARFLAEKVTFEAEGFPSISVFNASSASGVGGIRS